jgi:threonine 3-dehydrogenase
MTALVTGGLGFIGSELVKHLLVAGEARPVVFDVDSGPGRLADVAGSVELVRGDLGDPSEVARAVERARPDVVYHLGGMLTRESDADPAAALRANAVGTFNVLEAARRYGTPRVVFSSSIATFGRDMPDDLVGDHTLQRPLMFYGATKVFGEHMGLFFKRKHGLDFRGLRFPSVVGPGVRTPSVTQYNSRVIEECGKGNPYTFFVRPDTRSPVIYYKEAVRALVDLAAAPAERIETVNYVIAGTTPNPSAGELADAVRSRVPDARIDFQPDPEVQAVLDARPALGRGIDDRNARREWGWRSEYTLQRIVDEVLAEVRRA